MEYTEELQNANDQFWDMLTEGAILSKGILAVLCCASLFLLVYALIKKIRRRWESVYYALLCASVLVWSCCSLQAILVPESADMYAVLRIIAIIPIPTLLCLHVRQQVSYKKQHVGPAVLLFIVSVFLMSVICRDLFFPLSIPALPLVYEAEWYSLIFYLYASIALIRAYMLCFGVFYQMPRRTRRSSRYMLIGISSISILFILNALWNGQLSVLFSKSEILDVVLPLGAPIAFLIFLYSLYNAL